MHKTDFNITFNGKDTATFSLVRHSTIFCDEKRLVNFPENKKGTRMTNFFRNLRKKLHFSGNKKCTKLIHFLRTCPLISNKILSRIYSSKTPMVSKNQSLWIKLFAWWTIWQDCIKSYRCFFNWIKFIFSPIHQFRKMDKFVQKIFNCAKAH